MNPAVTLLRGAVTTYQWTLRPFIGCNCRFHPSCSDYAKEALSIHGALRGSAMAGARILRCNPWHPGGYDPVPAPAAGPEQTPTGWTRPVGEIRAGTIMSRAAYRRSGAARMRSARSKADLAATKG